MNRHAAMNRMYRLVWSQVRSAWVPVAETSRGRGKSGGARSIPGRNALAVAISLAVAPFAHTAPAVPPCASPSCGASSVSASTHPLGGRVVSGSASITQSGNVTDVRQSSADVSIDWLSFNVGSQATVDYIQPAASSVAVNRILSNSGSEILGHLDANGQVYLINPNGIIFGGGAQVNVGGLVASTLDGSDSGLTGETRFFAGTGTGSIINEGTIAAANGGYVALVGNHVGNRGVITAQLGTVALGAGSAVTLDFRGNRLVHLLVDQSTLDNLATNDQLIEADGGLVVMTAGAQRSLLASVVNNTGVIEARTVENHNGTIELLGSMTAGTVNMAGTLDASAPNGGNGGFIETNATHVAVANGTRVTTAAARGLTGSWLVDPQDFTIAASGGDITGATLSSELGTTSVTLLSSSGATAGSGNINVDDTVSWSAHTLTLTAANNIDVNAVMTATGSASLALNPSTANGADAAVPGGTVVMGLNGSGFTGMVNFNGTGTLSINGTRYAVINSLGAPGSTTGTDLQGINGNLAGDYVLGSSIDAAATSTWNGGAGFAPIGTSATPFTGIFDGLGHAISNLYINRATTNNVGLFGYGLAPTVIRNVGLLGGSVMGANSVGELVGTGYGATVNNSYATGNVAGAINVGGLVGSISGCFMFCSPSVTGINGTVSNSYATGAVSGSSNVGGLVGASAYSAVSNSFATGTVSGSSNVGGLVGVNDYGLISNSHAAGKVSGSSNVGGLLGYSYSGDVDNSFATGSVSGSSGSNGVGGLVGFAIDGPDFDNTAVSYSYATGTVTGGTGVGGLVGVNDSSINSSYSTGHVSGSSYVGGLVGNGIGGVTNNGYWNTTTSGQPASSGGTGLTTAQMQTASNFTGFTFTTTPGASGNNWVIVDVDGTLNNAGGVTGATYPMLASAYSTTINSALQLQLMAMNPAASYTLGQNINATATSSGGNVWAGSGFAPIGNSSTPFSGTFDGLGHAISGLTINLPTQSDVGLFGYGTGVIRNVGLIGGSVSGASQVGALVGWNYGGSISNSYSSAGVSGSGRCIGGLVGQLSYGSINGSHASGAVTGTASSSLVGGLLGGNEGSVNNSFASGRVSGASLVGGLVGANGFYGLVFQSYAAGNVSGTSAVGGLMGENAGGITQSYASGSASGTTYVGGLVGYNEGSNYGGGIVDSYATGRATGTSSVGGLVGTSTGGSYGLILNSYSIGSVSGASSVGGLVGSNSAVVTGSFWNVTTSGQSTSAGGIGMITANMQQQANFTSATLANGNVNPNWDFAGTWVMYNGFTYPLLRSFMTPLTVTANSGSVTYDGSAYNGANGVTYSVTPSGNLFGTLTFNSAAGPAVNVGSYLVTPGGLYSNQQGYIITYGSGALTINQLASVAWVGGATGNWSSAANWAGGAIPDLSNVAAVTIPKGDTVTYDTGMIALGTTKLKTLSSSGNLVMAAGTLDTTGNLSTAGFNQTGGTLDVGGALSIQSGSGGVTLGSIAAGSLNITSQGGAITQLASTALDVTGASTLTADNGATKYAVTLAQAGDSFGGTVTAEGSGITLDDKTALTAVLDSNGPATLTAAGAMNVSGTVGTKLTTTTTGVKHATTFGKTTVGKSLVVTSTGAVTETSSNILTVAGKGTTTVANPGVKVNGVKGAKIPAP